LDLLIPAIGWLADALTNYGVPALEGWWGVLGTVLTGAIDGIKAYIDWLVRFWQSTVEKFNFVRDHIGEFPDAVKALFAKAGEWLYNAGREIVNGLIEGIKTKFAAIGDTLGGL